VLTAKFRRRKTRFRLLQNPYYLLFRCIGSSASEVLLIRASWAQCIGELSLPLD
jgi:hypothetical protein